MGIVVSILFVIGVFFIVGLCVKLKWLSGEYARKAIHISVSHWWFIAMFYFEKATEAAIVPLFFIAFNYVLHQKNCLRFMEREDDFRSFGTIYYAISLFVLAIWSFGIERPEIGGMGILVMGYADGFAALVGTRFGKHKLNVFNKRKTVEGSLTVLVIASLVVFAFNQGFDMGFSVFEILFLGFAAMILEGITPLGFDNLTVPVGISVLGYILS